MQRFFLCVNAWRMSFFLMSCWRREIICTVQTKQGDDIMPSTYAHYRFGRDVYKKLPDDIKRIIYDERRLFLIGLHGPDILFYYKPLGNNRVNKIGYGMHDRSAREFFEQALEILEKEREKNTDAMMSYMYGFICHYALDHACHTYVEEKIHESGVPHAEIEVEFDRMLMVSDGLDPISQTLTDHISTDMRSASVINIFFPELETEDVQKALESMIFYNNLLVAPGNIKRGLIYALLFLSGNYKEMHGLIVNKKQNPLCADSNEKLMSLYEAAVPCCVSDIMHFANVFECGRNKLDERFDHTFGAEE